MGAAAGRGAAEASDELPLAHHCHRPAEHRLLLQLPLATVLAAARLAAARQVEQRMALHQPQVQELQLGRAPLQATLPMTTTKG